MFSFVLVQQRWHMFAPFTLLVSLLVALPATIRKPCRIQVRQQDTDLVDSYTTHLGESRGLPTGYVVDIQAAVLSLYNHDWLVLEQFPK